MLFLGANAQHEVPRSIRVAFGLAGGDPAKLSTHPLHRPESVESTGKVESWHPEITSQCNQNGEQLFVLFVLTLVLTLHLIQVTEG